MEPVTAAGDQVSGATLPLVQWQLPHGTTAVPCTLDRESGLVRNNWILGLCYENIFCFSSFITYAVKLLSLSPNWQWATWLTDSHVDSYCVLLIIATLFLILPSSFLVTSFQGSHAYSVSHCIFSVLSVEAFFKVFSFFDSQIKTVSGVKNFGVLQRPFPPEANQHGFLSLCNFM